MTTFQKVTKMATVPIGAAALTSASSLFLGRQTTSKSTTHVSNAASRKLHTAITNRCYQYQPQQQQQFYYSTNLNMATLRKVAQRQQQQQPQQQRNLSSAKVNVTTEEAAAASSSSTASKQANKSFLEWYEGHLQSRPVQTKMVTGSILWGLGDVVAQIVPTMLFDDDSKSDASEDSAGSSTPTSTSKELVYDYPRTARAMIFGFAIHAPLSHAHFNLLEWMTIKGGFTGLSIPVFKAFMEQFVYWSWFSNSLYHGAMGAMQGKSPQEVYDYISSVLWETQKAQWVFWIPVQLLNFRFVPVRHQLNVVLMTSVVWTALLSAWYPPENEESNAKNKRLEDKEER
mmetsp:Transcript_11533/g.14527  ORF Transcript_11533/g.14527 Transcript_11533/m.14527 type:complete len:343 (+) Transcript_11533:164-1192(+)